MAQVWSGMPLAIRVLYLLVWVRRRGKRVETETEPSMHALSRFAVTAVFTLTCFTVSVVTARAATRGLPATGGGGVASGLGAVGDPSKAVVSEGPGNAATPPAVDPPSTPAGSTAPTDVTPSGEGTLVTPGNGSGSGSGTETGTGAETVPKLDWGSGLGVTEQIRALEDQFKREQRDAIVRYREQLKAVRDTPSEERGRLREQIQIEYQQIREDLIERQKTLRDEIRRRFEEFQKEHPEHRELIDDAKERLKEKVRERRGYESV